MNTWAVMPTHDEVPERALVEEVLRYVDGLVIVDDGSDETIGRAIAAQADRVGAGLVRLPVQRGKGAALRAGLDAVRDHADAVLTIDADGQHPASAIPTSRNEVHARSTPHLLECLACKLAMCRLLVAVLASYSHPLQRPYLPRPF